MIFILICINIGIVLENALYLKSSSSYLIISFTFFTSFVIFENLNVILNAYLYTIHIPVRTHRCDIIHSFCSIDVVLNVSVFLFDNCKMVHKK